MKTPSSRFRHGGYAALITLFVLGGVVLANLIVGQIPVKLDLTASKMYSLSEQSLQVLKDLPEEVTIYSLFKPGTEPSNVMEMIKRYQDASSKIKLELLDVEKNPAFAKKYDPTGKIIGSGSLVVVSKKTGQFKVIPYIDLYDVGYDQQTGQQRVNGVAIEQQVTGALLYVASGVTPKIAELTNHGESSMEELGLADVLRKQNYTLEPLNLLTQKSIPQDTSLLLVTSPKTDLSEAETSAIKTYLEQGGNAFILVDLTEAPLKNLESVLNLYGVQSQFGIVLEGDQSFMVSGYPNLLLPNFGDHDILKPLKTQKYPVSFPNSLALQESPVKKRNLEIVSLLTSSPDSWLRTDLASQSATRTANEEKGPFTLGYATKVLQEDPTAKGTRMVVLASSIFINPQNPVMTPGNSELFLNSLSWVQNRKEGQGLHPKASFMLPLTLDGLQTLVFLFLFVVLIPLGVLVTGLVIWLKRRHL